MAEAATTNIGNWVEDQEFLRKEDKDSSTDLDRPITLEDLYHVGPGTLNGRFLRRFWHPVTMVSMIEPGHAYPMRRLGEDFTLYRGETGTFHAVAYRCAHRATQLSTGWVEGDCIRCFYHGWKYDETGQCVEQPDENERYKEKIKIRSYPTKEYLGLVFVYFGEGEPTEFPRYKSFEDPNGFLRTGFLSEGGIPHRDGFVQPCSFWNGNENDAFHIDWVHRDTFESTGRIGKVSVRCEETEYGFAETQTRKGAKHDSVTITHHIMPNIRLHWNRGISGTQRPDVAYAEIMRWSVPIDDDHFTVFGARVFHNMTFEETQTKFRNRRLPPPESNPQSIAAIGEGVLRGDWTLDNFPGRISNADGGDPRVFGAQDYVAQVGQGVTSMIQDEHLGRTDVQCAMLRRIYRRELTALVRGEELRAWKVPDEFTILISDREATDEKR